MTFEKLRVREIGFPVYLFPLSPCYLKLVNCVILHPIYMGVREKQRMPVVFSGNRLLVFCHSRGEYFM